jgi:hypothetical protein
MAEHKYYGMYDAKVTNINDPEKRARIKVKCPTVLGGDTESAWCEPCVQVAYDNGGDFCIPQKGETIRIMFIEGDANRPVYFGNWWQKAMTPLGSNYVNIDKLRIINYADCTITMRNGVIDINVGAGVCDLKIQHNHVTVKGNLTVEGGITCGTLHAVQGEYGGGTIKADSTVHGSNI